MTKITLLALALYGLGDDDFRVRQVSERYLAASGYVVVPLNRVAPRLTDDLQTRKTLRRLETHYYAWYDNLPEDWRAYPGLTSLSPWCQGYKDDVLDADDPFLGLVSRYTTRARTFRTRQLTRIAVAASQTARTATDGHGATWLLMKDLRSRGAPPWVGKLLLAYLRWHITYQERRYHFKDPSYTIRP